MNNLQKSINKIIEATLAENKPKDANASLALALGAATGFLCKEISKRDELLIALEKRLQSIEDRPVFRYAGIWAQGSYQAGEMVTCGGSMWHANEATTSKPGDGLTWQLCVKKGRDAK